MPVQELNTLKSWFETLDKPTQNHFWDLLDSVRHVNSKITIDDLEANLKALIESIDGIAPGAGGGVTTIDTIVMDGDGYYDLPVNYMAFKILVKPVTSSLLKIGTTAAGDELMLEKITEPGTYSGNGVSMDIIADAAVVRIYFTGITAGTIIKVYKLKLSI